MNEIDAEKSLQAEEYSDFKDNAQLKAIIAGQKAKRLSFKVNDIEIFMRGAIPKPLRDKLLEIQKDYENGETERADDEVYMVMATLCLEAPWNNPASWKYIDVETGEVPNILKQMMTLITDVEASGKNFRGKR